MTEMGGIVKDRANGSGAMYRLQIIVGSTRPERQVEPVTRWVVGRASAHKAFDVETLDLRDWPLPMFAEGMTTIGDIANPTYSAPIVKHWNQKIAEADAYVFITPEYNHSIPAVLKNAIDSVFVSFAFRNKPAAFVGYSGGVVGGARAVEHLAHIAIEAEMAPLRNTVLIAEIGKAFAADGMPVNPITTAALDILLEDLAWWSAALKHARAEGQLKPGAFRLGAARAAAAASS
jgi:NAD(P)H-dependent FMN reductase